MSILSEHKRDIESLARPQLRANGKRIGKLIMSSTMADGIDSDREALKRMWEAAYPIEIKNPKSKPYITGTA